MNKKTKLGFTIKAFATAVAIVVPVLNGYNIIAASIWKMTYPSLIMFFLNILSLLPIITFLTVAALPLKYKIGLNIHFFNEACILIGLIINGIAFTFDFRYTMLYGLFSEQTVKALMVVFYAMLLTFHKTGGKFRNATITIGAFLCAFKLVYFYFMKNPVLHERYSLSALCSILGIALLVVIVSAFSDLDRFTYFSRSKKYPFPHYVVYAYRCSEQEFAIIRVTNDIIYIQNLQTGKSMFSALYHYDETFFDSEEASNKASVLKKKFEQQLKIGERYL